MRDNLSFKPLSFVLLCYAAIDNWNTHQDRMAMKIARHFPYLSFVSLVGLRVCLSSLHMKCSSTDGHKDKIIPFRVMLVWAFWKHPHCRNHSFPSPPLFLLWSCTSVLPRYHIACKMCPVHWLGRCFCSNTQIGQISLKTKAARGMG